MDRAEAVRIAAASLEPWRREVMRLEAVVEYPECWSVSFDWSRPDAEVRALPTSLRLEVDKVTRKVTEYPGR